MALTAEQVLNKHFQTTQFRKGYDERDVDDFLDEIVAEMRSLIAQRDDYKQQLNDCRAGRGLGSVADAPVAPVAVAAPADAPDLEAANAAYAQ
ncbi:MAG TPA: DivIVA domain-containing protein, partial [Dermatophilaceae bacterium]|nr:DivIVA domain-containing protein [Dermatophilaceae bacterium]